jgi:hypothetical protein
MVRQPKSQWHPRRTFPEGDDINDIIIITNEFIHGSTDSSSLYKVALIRGVVVCYRIYLPEKSFNFALKQKTKCPLPLP